MGDDLWTHGWVLRTERITGLQARTPQPRFIPIRRPFWFIPRGYPAATAALTLTGLPLDGRSAIMAVKVERRRQQAQLFTPAHRNAGQSACGPVLVT